MPLERPEFLETDPAAGEVHERTIHKAVVPQQTDHLHSIRGPAVVLRFRTDLLLLYQCRHRGRKQTCSSLLMRVCDKKVTDQDKKDVIASRRTPTK
jgi:hypothetical protein